MTPDAPRQSILVAAIALVDDAGLVLLTRRPQGKPLAGLWEFPGGKVEAGETPEGALIRARTSFLVDDRVDDGSVRDIILASWNRSREWNIDADGAELSAFDTESDSLLVRAARSVLDSVTDELAGEPVSVILTDADGVVL